MLEDQMDKVFLEYYIKRINQTAWNSRAEWKIYDASAPSTLLTRGHVYNAANVNGYVDFDWSYPGNLLNPINQPPVILPGGTQTYIVTADIVDDSAGPNAIDYIQVRANDDLTFTPVVGGTLGDAHSVDSHFIWHTASGLYYNEAYTDLMDMWGGIPNAFAQWRKRIWGGPVVNYTRTDLLTDLFNIKGQPLISGPSGCTDTTPTQEAVWATGIYLSIVLPYSTGLCGPNDVITRAATSKILASYSAFVTGNMTLVSPAVQTFPDVLLATWYFGWVESMYAAMGSVYAIVGNNFYPSDLLNSLTAVTWITNLP